ncbi:hypothetical protein PCC9214_05354 [Planktothrix tepida]|uniref:Uncharacterized protein n=1 Tax=Planktothrix tepida PCC 9214 TaxID=671072 RepID=A0A1J1LI16_9CYAN|nr:hypothetical protein [Planktothrix tepida]CAD5984908.1 hypothetical protein PCC9214_05316 [Planktothrix tepida]CAD5985185.1 hypothetical protein PCC9214_05354 [Planktothrix tepida]CUR32135.1 conserved hypothetical protein [Planktothrix tepida PCC 9214]
MGLLGRFMGGGSKSKSSTEGFDFTPGSTQSISGQEYNWSSYYQGNFDNFQRITPEEVEAAEETAKEMEQQVGLYGRKFQADTSSVGSVRRIHNSEQVHTRNRITQIVGARDQAIKTQEHLAEKIAPQIHEQNERLGLSQEKGQRKIAQISEQFSKRREALANLRGGM